MGCCQPVLAPIENYYNKWQIDRMLEEIESAITSGCCITPEEVDDKIESAKTEIESEIPSLSGYATEDWVENKGYITGVDLSDYATLEDIPDVDSELSSGSTNPVANSAITDALDDKVNVIDNEVSPYYTTVEYLGYFPASGTSASTWNDMISTAKIRFVPPYECMTQPYNVHISDENGFVTSGNIWSNISSLSPYATVTTESEGAPTYYTWYVITPNEGYRISYIEAKRCDDGTLRPTVPLKIPQILYDGGQSADVIQNEIEPELDRLNDAINSIPTYSAGTGIDITDNVISVTGGTEGITSAQCQTLIDESISGKTIDSLSAGTNVTISNNVISATDTTYSAGSGITISNNVISTVTKFWCGTEQEWGQISGGTLDSNTIYMVH